MNTEPPQVHRVERVDDIPVLLGTLKQMNVAEILDRHFPSGHRWKGELTFGEVACVWLSYIASEGDHRLYEVQPWAERHLHTLEACLGKSVRGLDFQDDRLADMLDHLALDKTLEEHPVWQDCEVELNQHHVRVYNLKADIFRIDTSTANSYVEVQSELGYFQFGHSKDRDDLPQIKIAMSTLDPLGMSVTIFAVPGNCPDDPLYVPEIKKVQQAFPQPGKSFVMDCKGIALATRAYLAQSGDYYLGPMTEKQVSAEQRRALLQPVWQGQQPLQQVCRPAADGQSEELVAEGFYVDVPLTAEVNSRQVSWTERRWLVRSMAYAAGQHKQLDRRLQKAQEQLAQLNERKQGKKRLTAKEMQEAAEEIVKKQRVEGMLSFQVKTTTHTRKIRGYKDRPARVVKQREHRLEVSVCEEAIAQAKREMGWRVYATNQLELNLAAVVWAYRGQNRLEDNWSRLKGKPCGLTPMFFQYDSRIVGLVLLLSLVLRLLTLLEWTVRRKLQESGQTLKGLYPGQPGRQANRPSAELLLRAFRGINLTIVEAAGQRVTHVTPLTDLQQTLLALWGLPPDLYQCLTVRTLELPPELHHRLTLHFAEPPPAEGEREARAPTAEKHRTPKQRP
jgi:transposase